MRLNVRHIAKHVKKKIFDWVAGTDNAVGKLNRHTREVWLESTLALLASKSRILDAGAGELQYKQFCTHLDYVSQDFGQYDGMGDGIGFQKGTWDQTQLDIVSDITCIPEPDGSFDAVMCIEVLEHVPYPVEALRELTRLLRSGGTLIVTAPFCSLTHFAPYHFQTGYSRYFYEYWLKEMGYEVEDIQFNGSYFEYLAQEIHRLPQIGREYTNGCHIRWYERLAIAIMLKLLWRFSLSDAGSSNLLCYGLHVRARKL